MKSIITFISFLFVLLFSKGYSSDVKFYSINSVYGISERETNTICQDDKGFIWTSSKSGILRITEGDCRIYHLPYKTADVVSVKLTYSKSKLYAYTNNGQLFKYNDILDKFEFLLDLPKVFKSKYLVVQQLYVENEKVFWLATSDGLYHYTNGVFTLKKTDGCENNSIQFYNSNHLFYITKKGISLLDTKSLSTKTIFKTNSELFLDISKYHYDLKLNKLWIGTLSNGLYSFDLKQKKLESIQPKYFPKQPVLAIAANTDSTLLIGIDGQGIWEITKSGDRILNVYKENADNPESLRGDGVYDIFCSNDKRVWVSTYTGGLSFYDQKSPLITQITHRINIPASLSDNNVNKVIEDRRGRLWFATDNGVDCWDRSNNSWKIYYQNKKEHSNVFLALKEDANGNIWAGTYSSGVYVLDGNSGRELMHLQNGWLKTSFSANFVFDFCEDSQGNMWIAGVQSNLICYKSQSKEFKTYEKQPVKAIRELVPGKMLLACTYGLVLMNEATRDFKVLVQGIISQDILVQKNLIWVATSGDGLIKYDLKTNKYVKFTVENGLPSNYVNSIILSNNLLWLGTENGLCKFDPVKSKVDIFPSTFQLSNTAFNLGAKCQLRNGDLLFGTSNGAVLFNPTRLNDNLIKGAIFYQDIKASGRSIRDIPEMKLISPVNDQQKITLKHDQNTLEIELLAIGVSLKGVKFSWMMEGLDKNWNLPAARKMITYTNLPSGNFKLRIKMYDSSLTRLIDERFFNVHVIPPFWERWWFVLLIIIGLVLIAYFALKTYTDRLNQQHAEDKIRFFANTAHDIRTSLTLISAPIEEINHESNLSDKGRYYLNLAKEQVGRLSFVATQLLDFQKVDVGKGQLFLVMVDVVELIRRRVSMYEASATKMNIKLIFSSSVSTYFTAVDKLKFEKIVDNLISNALKYSLSDSNIDVRFDSSDDYWCLEVKDYGLGISDNAQKKLFREFYRGDNVVNSKIVGSGIGLLLVKNYVTMHNGQIELTSKIDEGTSFRITIPFKEVSEVITFEDELESISETQLDPLDLINTDKGGDKKTHILIVEDNNDLQNFIKVSFEPQYKISVASDGKQAWESIQSELPDLIISDVMMPEMDGFQLCKLIKSTFDTSHIPVILLTALSDRTNELEGLHLGAEAYVTKPFDIGLLKERINSIIRNRDVVRDKAAKLIYQSDNDEPILTNEHNDKFVKKAIEVVRNNMANCDFGKDQFASEMNASSSLLYKKIKSLTGQSPVDFIKDIRLNHSLELLQSKKYTVTEVSELCGFSSIGYFSTVFKKHFGKPPTELN